MWKLLMTTGIILILISLMMFLMEKSKIFPLPGDIVIKRGNFVLIIPITSMIILSIILTIVMSLFRR
ncbi:DUF2905 domain-containing protein [Thermosipho africanus]|uniref:DUF2905 domain-containing protein n=1 Tax=Thermosipho africanus TaxID=2421 RepID=UPI002804ECC7|nr:DUF2905 domain-containing protein [Thermosipho africanus]